MKKKEKEKERTKQLNTKRGEGIEKREREREDHHACESTKCTLHVTRRPLTCGYTLFKRQTKK